MKIQCHREADARALHSVNWGEWDQAPLIKPTHAVVVHRVSKLDVDLNTDQEDIVDHGGMWRKGDEDWANCGLLDIAATCT